MTLQEILERLSQVRRSGEGYKALCPAHEDKNPSLTISQGENGRTLLKCHAGCSTEAIVKAMGQGVEILFSTKSPRTSHAVRSWELRDTTGKLWAVHKRRDPPGKDKIVWWEKDGKRGLGGLKSRDLPLYGSEHLPTFDKGRPVYLCEGEKDCDSLLNLQVQALGTVTGASNAPSHEVLETLRGHSEIRLWPDADPQGKVHMLRVAAELRALGCSFSFVLPRANCTNSSAPAAQ